MKFDGNHEKLDKETKIALILAALCFLLLCGGMGLGIYLTTRPIDAEETGKSVATNPGTCDFCVVSVVKLSLRCCAEYTTVS